MRDVDGGGVIPAARRRNEGAERDARNCRLYSSHDAQCTTRSSIEPTTKHAVPVVPLPIDA